MKGGGRGLTPKLLSQVMMSAFLKIKNITKMTKNCSTYLCTLGRGQTQEVGQLQIPLVAGHQQGVTQTREAMVSCEVKEVGVVLVPTLTAVLANVI